VGTEPSELNSAWCQPGGRSTSTTVSTMPLALASTFRVWPPIRTSTRPFSTGTLVKLRQPRLPFGSSSLLRCRSLVSSTRASSRTQDVDP
jgi:hypothetical protein